jgi:hypothetical protein
MNRIYHTWDKWECYPAGFYESKHKTLTDQQCREMYRDFLRDIDRFNYAIAKLFSEWPNSCEHYLSNENMNRLAWLGQAAVCISHGIPAQFRGGFNMLTDQEQELANQAALNALNVWLFLRGESELTMDSVKSKTEANLY